MMSDFAKQIELSVKEAKGKVKEVIVETRKGVADSVINRTPLDTGYARGNWQSSIDIIIPDTITRYDREAGYAPTGGTGIAMREAEEVAEMDVEDDFILFNNAEYISGLEYGTSRQAPAGMVRLTVADFPSIMGDAIRKVKK